MKCRHSSNSWLVMAGDYGVEWCWRCGAFREVRRTGQASVSARPRSWVRPVGDGAMPEIPKETKR